MKLSEQMRREYEHGGGSIRWITRRLGVRFGQCSFSKKQKKPERKRPKAGCCPRSDA